MTTTVLASSGAGDEVQDILAVEGVTKSFGNVRALDEVSLRVRRGEMVAITGRSGSGKTTLLNVASTLSRPDTGAVWVDGVDAAARSDRELSALRAHTVGLVFQRFHLAPGRTAVAIVADGLLYLGVPAQERAVRASRALESVGLGHRLLHRPHQLSGGECQRVAIARAVIREPLLLFADEPTGNLDTESAAAVNAILRQLNERGTTIVVVTHDPEYAATLPRNVVMADGRVVHDNFTSTDQLRPQGPLSPGRRY